MHTTTIIALTQIAFYSVFMVPLIYALFSSDDK